MKINFFLSAVEQTRPRDAVSEIGCGQNLIHLCSAKSFFTRLVESFGTLYASTPVSSLSREVTGRQTVEVSSALLKFFLF